MVAGNTIDSAAAGGSGAAANSARSLADVLAAGPLPLPMALAYATEIASRAAAVHREGRALGTLSPSRIGIGTNGPLVPAPSGISHLATQASDLRDFGLLLYQMLTGLDPADYAPPADTDDDLEPSPRTVKSAALRLVERCCRRTGESDMRHVSTELRLLEVMVNSFNATELAEAAAQERPIEPAVKPVAPAVVAEPIELAAPAKAVTPAKPVAPAAPAPKTEQAAETKPTAAGKPEAAVKLTAPKNRNWGCPSCGSAEYFLCQHLTLFEKLLALVGLKTYRCYRCFQRFISVFGEQVPRPENG